ncbi:periplasmic binding protein-like I [Pseudohyphozyma bogoriensis]|nr:periplasmic binding protein-like I [Pseudohyphozyma bogoriensis]
MIPTTARTLQEKELFPPPKAPPASTPANPVLPELLPQKTLALHVPLGASESCPDKCPDGHIVSEDSTKCTQCTIGTTNNKCLACPDGSFTTWWGASECFECYPG